MSLTTDLRAPDDVEPQSPIASTTTRRTLLGAGIGALLATVASAFGRTQPVQAQDGDTIILQGDFNVLVDEMSLGYINGSEVDYVDSLMGAGFTVNNPNAVSSCGCGHSFKTAEGGGEAKGCGCGH